MSRCFPYPPPGYVRNGFGGEALIESIKLQREREKAKADGRKERKREKKEKKRDKKEKGKEKYSDIFDGKGKKLNDDRSRKGESIKVDSKGGHLQKSVVEAEQLEKSDLTEEHGQPICSESLCYSSDGTRNSSKRKRDISPEGNHNHGNIIRIRLPLRKHKDPDVSYSEDQLCSTSGRTGTYAQQEYEIARVPSQEQCCSTSNSANIVAKEFTFRPDGEQLYSASGSTEIFAQDGAGIASGSTFLENEAKGAESLYKALIEDWVSPPLQCVQSDDEDLQWLFEKKQHDGHVAKRLKTTSDDSCRGNSIWGPRAHFLLEADIYALPYTIPF